MGFTNRMWDATALGAVLVIGVGLSASPARAGYTVSLSQQGSNVVATGSGTIDLTGLTPNGSGISEGGVGPLHGEINTGPASFVGVSWDTGYTGPTSFGSGGELPASSGSGDTVGIGAFGVDLVVPSGYVSGSALSDTSTYDNQTFASLGVTPGSYVWTWGRGATADSFTLQIGAASVPEPSGAALLALPLGLLMLFGARRRRATCNT
ncbi:MAG TPA: hypothetical protein VFW75_11005 [Acetobacteraceae bacterium]|nr:hypothetical protein [Acetobacteraceae bacterium]